jgi:glycosyltransferase involved in cell wall biosynthesis
VTRPLYGEIADLYGLADVVVSASLTEGFGLGIVEAMCSGLPVLMHDNEHFRWLAGHHSCHVDMEKPGALAERLRQLSADGEGTRRLGESLREQACQRFDWSNLKKDYIDMYSRIYEQSKSNCKSKAGQEHV